MNGFYSANTEKQFNTVVTQLLNNGYEWVGLNKKPTFEECKRKLHGNAKLIIHAFYNDINHKNEIQFGTKSIYISYPQYKGKIKVINDLTSVINNAKLVAKRDGYKQVIIEDKDGMYSFSREYDDCCPEWYGRIIGRVVPFWENGILKSKYATQ